MAWSQDEERMLAMIERHLTDEDPKLAARIESFNHRVERREHGGRRRPADPSADGAGSRWPRRSTLIITLSWVLIVVLITALLIMALQHNAAALAL
ncbi:DUF3040 domain-containing protein [Sphaerimonospora sp. CA-214678]|uniref:DUF3040 domain-containing protein n=1 Tax=Sphaerimonospora sp. CA-214678 TaxID=3240029 RepID=UPI003D8CB8FA